MNTEGWDLAPAQSKLLVVERNRRNLDLMAQFLGRAGYVVLCAETCEEANRALDAADQVDLVLLDLAGFDPTIWAFCERLRINRVPFLVISPRASAGVQSESLSHGAQGVLIKPLVTQELLSVIRGLLKAPAK